MNTAGITAGTQVRLGSVSYLNAKPLLWGLEDDEQIDLHLEVPSKLLEGLQSKRFDIALLPVIDYQRMAGLKIVPSGGIASDGETLTVRIFSRVPIRDIRTLACDTDSHTSVALARVLLAEHFGLRPEFVDLKRGAVGGYETVLLIGDKVVCEEPAGFEHQLDLGQTWNEMTGLPFVFAVWMARGGVELGDLPERLEAARREGLEHVEEIIVRHALPRGWPADVARRYMTKHLKYDIGAKDLEAIRLFHRLSGKHGLVGTPVRELVLY